MIIIFRSQYLSLIVLIVLNKALTRTALGNIYPQDIWYIHVYFVDLWIDSQVKRKGIEIQLRPELIKLNSKHPDKGQEDCIT